MSIKISRTRELGARSDISRHSSARSLHSIAEIIVFTPGPLHPADIARATRWSQHRFAPLVHFGLNSDLCATALRLFSEVRLISWGASCAGRMLKKESDEMRDAQVREALKQLFRDNARWRRDKALEYERNVEAADLLEKLVLTIDER